MPKNFHTKRNRVVSKYDEITSYDKSRLEIDRLLTDCPLYATINFSFVYHNDILFHMRIINSVADVSFVLVEISRFTPGKESFPFQILPYFTAA